jgi:hypothetical protein
MANEGNAIDEALKGKDGISLFLLRLFGRDTFVAVLFLVFWWVVVRPTLDEQSADEDLIRELVRSNLSLAGQLEKTAEHQKATALILERLTSTIAQSTPND